MKASFTKNGVVVEVEGDHADIESLIKGVFAVGDPKLDPRLLERKKPLPSFYLSSKAKFMPPSSKVQRPRGSKYHDFGNTGKSIEEVILDLCGTRGATSREVYNALEPGVPWGTVTSRISILKAKRKLFVVRHDSRTGAWVYATVAK